MTDKQEQRLIKTGQREDYDRVIQECTEMHRDDTHCVTSEDNPAELTSDTLFFLVECISAVLSMMSDLMFQHFTASVRVWLQIACVPATTLTSGSHLVF